MRPHHDPLEPPDTDFSPYRAENLKDRGRYTLNKCSVASISCGGLYGEGLDLSSPLTTELINLFEVACTNLSSYCWLFVTFQVPLCLQCS